jgi:phosphocarrier protein
MGDGDMETLVQEVSVSNELGLHARPAARIAQEAQKYEAEICFCQDEREIDAKSILDILTLAAPRGSGLRIKARGSDAREALASLCRLFEERFGEER